MFASETVKGTFLSWGMDILALRGSEDGDVNHLDWPEGKAGRQTWFLAKLQVPAAASSEAWLLGQHETSLYLLN